MVALSEAFPSAPYTHGRLFLFFLLLLKSILMGIRLLSCESILCFCISRDNDAFHHRQCVRGARQILIHCTNLRWFWQCQNHTVIQKYSVYSHKESIISLQRRTNSKAPGWIAHHRTMDIGLIPSTGLLIRSVVLDGDCTWRREVRPTSTPPQPSGCLIYDQRSTGWSITALADIVVNFMLLSKVQTLRHILIFERWLHKTVLHKRIRSAKIM